MRDFLPGPTTPLRIGSLNRLISARTKRAQEISKGYTILEPFGISPGLDGRNACNRLEETYDVT